MTDAQYPFASREDIWRVHEEVKDIYTTQVEHGERISRLERRRDEDARLKSVWEPSFNPAAEAFKGFDQVQHHSLANNLNLESEEEPRRGASRANSVRFDESTMHGYYGQGNRSTSELVPTRTGSGLGSHPLTERSLSHRSDGKQSSSGQSHHSTRTNSLGLDTTRLPNGLLTRPVVTPPPGLFILGPVPCIIRCWLTTNFSNDSLLYAAVCTGSCTSTLSYRMVQGLGLEGQMSGEDGVRSIKLPVYLPEASIYQSSSRGGSPVPQLPAVTVRFLVRDTDPNDKCIQIFLGSDVLRAHNADILFSQDKMLIVDDERNKISIPLVRPENDSAFKTLSTGPEPCPTGYAEQEGDKETEPLQSDGEQVPEVMEYGHVASPQPKSTTSKLTLRTSSDSIGNHRKSRSSQLPQDPDGNSPDQPRPRSTTSDRSIAASSKAEGSGVWGSWRRDSNAGKGDSSPYLSAYQRSTRPRNMKVLKPTKSSSSSRQVSSATTASSVQELASPHAGDSDHRTCPPPGADSSEPPKMTPNHSRGIKPADGPWVSGPRSVNPVGGASAFGWLNPNQQTKA